MAIVVPAILAGVVVVFLAGVVVVFLAGVVVVFLAGVVAAFLAGVVAAFLAGVVAAGLEDEASCKLLLQLMSLSLKAYSRLLTLRFRQPRRAPPTALASGILQGQPLTGEFSKTYRAISRRLGRHQVAPYSPKCLELDFSRSRRVANRVGVSPSTDARGTFTVSTEFALINEIGRGGYSTTMTVPRDGIYLFAVEADGPYTLQIE